MPFLNKLFGKNKKPSFASPAPELRRAGKATEGKPVAVEQQKEKVKPAVILKSDILLSPITTEKAVSSQSLNKYIFKVSPKANKIEIAKSVGRAYNVKAVSVNIINIPRKVRRVGKTKGFKAGYKKAIVTLAKGQTIEVK